MVVCAWQQSTKHQQMDGTENHVPYIVVFIFINPDVTVALPQTAILTAVTRSQTITIKGTCFADFSAAVVAVVDAPHL